MFLKVSSVCNSCVDLMVSVDITGIAVVNIEGVGYHCIIVGITKSEAINLLENADLSEFDLINIKY